MTKAFQDWTVSLVSKEKQVETPPWDTDGARGEEQQAWALQLRGAPI